MVDQLNEIASTWWEWMLSMFWQVGILIVLIGIIDLMIRKWAWPQLRYALWLLVLVKLVLPPSLTSPTSLTSNLQPLAKEALAAQMQKSETTEVADSSSYPLPMPVLEYEPITEPLPLVVQMQQTQPVGGENPPLETVASSIAKEPTAGEVGTVAPRVKLHWKFHLMLVWFLGIWILTGWFILHWQQLIRQVRKQSTTDKLPDWFFDSLRETAELLGLRRIPNVAVSSKIATPAVFGLFRPTLLMPTANLDKLSRRDARHILLHELAHIKRRDPLIHTFNLLLQIVYWFNPLLWLVRKQLQHLRELCCDATVAKILKENTMAYREILLETAKRLLAKPVEPGLGLLGLFENSNRLVTRLKWLEKKTWKHARIRFAAIVLVIAAVSVCILPMAQAEKNSEDAALIREEPAVQSNTAASEDTSVWKEKPTLEMKARDVEINTGAAKLQADEMNLAVSVEPTKKTGGVDFQLNPEDQNRVKLQIQNMKVKKLPEFITAFTGKTVIMEDDRIGDQSITIYSQQEITKDQALQLIRSALKLKQIQLEERDGILYLGFQSIPPTVKQTESTPSEVTAQGMPIKAGTYPSTKGRFPDLIKFNFHVLRVTDLEPVYSVLGEDIKSVVEQPDSKRRVPTVIFPANKIAEVLRIFQKMNPRFPFLNAPHITVFDGETARITLNPFPGTDYPFEDGMRMFILPRIVQDDKIILDVQATPMIDKKEFLREQTFPAGSALGVSDKQAVIISATLESQGALFAVLPEGFLDKYQPRPEDKPFIAGTDILIIQTEIIPIPRENATDHRAAPSPSTTTLPGSEYFRDDRPWSWYLAMEELRNLQQKKIEAKNQVQQALMLKKEYVEISHMSDTHPELKRLEKQIKVLQQQHVVVLQRYEEASMRMRDLDEKIRKSQDITNQIRFLQQQQQKLEQRILDMRIEYESADSVQQQKKAESLLQALQKQRDRVEAEIHNQQEQLKSIRRQMN